jgi:hypothetical protein
MVRATRMNRNIMLNPQYSFNRRGAGHVVLVSRRGLAAAGAAALTAQESLAEFAAVTRIDRDAS